MPDETPIVVSQTTERAEKFLKSIMRNHDLDHPLTTMLLAVGIPALAKEMNVRPKDYLPVVNGVQQSKVHLEKPDMATLAESVSLPAMPEVAVQLERVTSDPSSSAQNVADVISLDPSLSTILLHIVNSAFYNFPSKIDSIPRAVSIVGTSQLHALALGRMVLNMANEMPPKHFNMDVYWEHCVATGVIAKELATLCNFPNPERHFLAGLLHDIGKLAIAKALPRHAEALNLIRHHSVPHIAEESVLGFDHARFGAMILRKWNIPYQIVEAVAHHHHPEEATHPEGARILHLADIIARALVIPSSDVPLSPSLSKGAWSSLCMKPELLKDALGGLEGKMHEMVEILMGKN
ncbi:HDOD domain-containing protein [Desulfovibrio ferrophilus]|uniref:Metal dependent phosphohydrolase n=1 Tax=Desulfovibrio ferrophilus TaxID=241368 RepID=A0A2Z6AWR4_9BACT|nr:HDOD domain-containing protein [Desulfovibrio ferrophilus]BBD07638.1 metal dependent phosphohydrolase [Desulfovibrio ferrophilus]